MSPRKFWPDMIAVPFTPLFAAFFLLSSLWIRIIIQVVYSEDGFDFLVHSYGFLSIDERP